MSPAIPKPKRRTKRSSRRTYCDTLWSQAVRQRDGYCQMDEDEGMCDTCHDAGCLDGTACLCWCHKSEHGDCEGRLEAAHMIPRRHYSTRWELDVGVTLCLKHHRLFDGVFDRFSFASKRLGEARWAELQEQARQRFHRDYTRVIEELKERLKEQSCA